MKANLANLWERLARSQTLTSGAIAVVVGLSAGVGVWLFKQAIALVQWGLAGSLGQAARAYGGWLLVLAPALGGLLVGLISQYLIGEERLHGVAGIMEAVALAGGRLRYRRVPLKAAASAISIGAGAAVGPEDPSVQIGANLGSMFGQLWRLSDERVRTLVAAGAAAAIAAAFNAPIAGVFFALELILGEIGGDAMGILLVASVSSAVVTQAVSGPEPAFHVPAYAFGSAWELPLYLGLGLLAGPVAALYVRLLYLMQDLFRAVRLPRWAKTAAAGLVVGLVGLALPQVLGVGYQTIAEILNQNSFSIWLLLALMLGKLALTPLSIGGGFAGGVFAPSLYIGAALGGAYGLAMAALFPGLGLNPATFALAGMAAVLAGAVHAPLTAVLLLFEMTNDYHLILPLMFAVAVSLILSRRLQRDSVYAMGLARHGIRLERGRDVEVMEGLRVGEVMFADAHSLPEDASLLEAAETLASLRRHGLPVTGASGELVGILTLQDIDQVDPAQRGVTRVGAACTRDLLVAYPDETLGEALLNMSHRDLGRLPVVDRANPRKLLGVLRRADIIRAYELALTRRANRRHQAHQTRLDALTHEQVTVVDVAVDPAAACVGKKMSEIAWPAESLIASVQRGREVFIPHGDTVIEAGDTLVVVASQEAGAIVARLCGKSAVS